MRGPIDRVSHRLRGRVPFAVLVLAIAGLAIAVPPATAADGSGVMTTGNFHEPGATGQTIVFTYTAAAGGLNGGELTVEVPSAWPEPSINAQASGYVLSKCGTVATAGFTIKITGVTLAEGAACAIEYGAKPGIGVSVPMPGAPYVFPTKERSTSAGTLTALPASPEILIGTKGTILVAPTKVGTTASQTLTFNLQGAATYNGAISITVPSTWSAPSTEPTAPGYTTSSCGTLAVTGSEIAITALTVSLTEACAIAYGSTAGGGPGASSATTNTGFETKETAWMPKIALATTPTKPGLNANVLKIRVNGQGSVGGEGITCTDECREHIVFGALTTLTATPSPGQTFHGWDAEECSGTGTCTLKLANENGRTEATVTAAFSGVEGKGGGTTTGETTTTGTTGETTGTTGTTTTTGATTGTAGTTGTTGTPTPSAPTCTLKASSTKIKVPKTPKHAKHAKKKGGAATVALVVDCNQSVNVSLEGELTEKGSGGKPTVVRLKRTYGSLSAGASQTLKLTIPASALKALEDKATESATFTLAAKNTHDEEDRVSAAVPSLTE